jgi:hypothetical protein
MKILPKCCHGPHAEENLLGIMILVTVASMVLAPIFMGSFSVNIPACIPETDTFCDDRFKNAIVNRIEVVSCNVYSVECYYYGYIFTYNEHKFCRYLDKDDAPYSSEIVNDTLAKYHVGNSYKILVNRHDDLICTTNLDEEKSNWNKAVIYLVLGIIFSLIHLSCWIICIVPNIKFYCDSKQKESTKIKRQYKNSSLVDNEDL